MTKKFSLVTYLEGDIKKQVRLLQEELIPITGSRACIDTWEPHVTVGSGPEVDTAQEAQLIEEIRKIAENTKPFVITLKDFSYLEKFRGGNTGDYSPYVMYLDVVKNDALQTLADTIKAITDTYSLWYEQPWPYTPHVTVAFKDLWEEGFKKGKEYLAERGFEGEMTIDHIALVEKTPEKDSEYKRIYLS